MHPRASQDADFTTDDELEAQLCKDVGSQKGGIPGKRRRRPPINKPPSVASK